MEVDLSPLVITLSVVALFFAAVIGFRDGKSV